MQFDTHAHYDDARFDEDRDEVIERVHSEGVTFIVNAGSDVSSSVESITLAEKFDYVYAAIGIHPHNVSFLNESIISAIGEFSTNPNVVAIGEIGLDYYYDHAPKEVQKHWFARQINLAKNLNLPIIVHDRDAHEDVMKIMKNEQAKQVGGVLHCFSGSAEMAKELVRDGFYIALGGAVTFKNAKKFPEVVRAIPDELLLVETDCPYMTPEPFRGKRNDSGLMKYTVQKIAEIKGYSIEDIENITTGNAKRLFKIK